MRCTIDGCEAEIVRTLGGVVETTVGYFSPPGHDHDDNCLRQCYQCAAGHTQFFSIRRKCPAPGCDWVGKPDCWCHRGPEKVRKERPPNHHPREYTAYSKFDAWPVLS